MKTQPHPSDREVLAGLVERVTYQNAETGFCVIRVKARSHRDLVTVVGHAATIAAGEWITASGDWVNDRIHACRSRGSRSNLASGMKELVRTALDLELQEGKRMKVATGFEAKTIQVSAPTSFL